MKEASKRQRDSVRGIAERIAGLGYALWDERAESYVFVSEQFARPYGLTPHEYVTRYDISHEEVPWIHPDDYERYEAYYRAYLDNPKECSIEVRYRALQGDYFHAREFWVPIYDDSNRLIQSVVVLLHITELKHAEEALRRAQKMEAVGQLAGGIAHDFNNMLAVIMGNLELLSDRDTDASRAPDLIDMTMYAAERGAELTSRLLAFTREQTTQEGSFDLRELADGMLGLLQRTLGPQIDIAIESPPNLWPCRVDRSQFENSLLNLALNARDAMLSRGMLKLEFSNVEIAKDRDQGKGAIIPGEYVRVTVTDTGIGMAPDVVEHAVEPYFTTKGEGSGSGLGLSMVYGFAQQFGGHLDISSRLQHGTTVEMLIPRDPGATLSDVVDLPSRGLPRSHGECVLLVDDDAAVLEMTARILESLDYEVKSARSAHEALGVLDASARIDLLMTDVMLGGGYSGPELTREIEHRRPDLPVLFVSGFPQRKLEASGYVGSEVAFLAKPFRKAQLAQAVRRALDGG